MVTSIKMTKWSKESEEELINLIKDWLKVKGRSQSDLKESLKASSTRMQAMLEVIKQEYLNGGMQRVAYCLCKIEEDWSKGKNNIIEKEQNKDPFGQLDLLLEDIRDVCDN